MNEIKINESPWQALKLIVGSFLFIVGAYYMVTSTEENSQEQTFNTIIGWVGILFFGLGLILGLYKLITNKPQVIINELGVWKVKSIFSKYKEEDVVKWNEIKNVSVEKKGSYVYVETEYDLLEIKLKSTNMIASQLVNLINENRKIITNFN